jgi:hypothetical protein
MKHPSRPTAARIVAFTLVAAASLALLAGFFPHTDDGCQVEIHCLACRFALASACTTPPQVAAHVILELAEAPAGATSAVRLELPIRGPSSRGPPSSTC